MRLPAIILCCASCVFAAAPVRVLVAYHSDTGNTEKMAAAVREGARKQAYVPEGAAVLEPVGTAPGLLVPTEGPLIVVLPGPPRELQTMWEAAVVTAPLSDLLARAGHFEQRMLRFYVEDWLGSRADL